MLCFEVFGGKSRGVLPYCRALTHLGSVPDAGLASKGVWLVSREARRLATTPVRFEFLLRAHRLLQISRDVVIQL